MNNEYTDKADDRKEHNKFYTVFVDDVEYRFDHTPITGGEVMDVAGIPHSIGIVIINEDGSQTQVGATDEVDLEPGRRFKKAPRFKRG